MGFKKATYREDIVVNEEEMDRYVKQLEDYIENDGSCQCYSCGWDGGRSHFYRSNIDYWDIVDAVYFNDKKLIIYCKNKDYDESDTYSHRGFTFYFD